MIAEYLLTVITISIVTHIIWQNPSNLYWPYYIFLIIYSPIYLILHIFSKLILQRYIIDQEVWYIALKLSKYSSNNR